MAKTISMKDDTVGIRKDGFYGFSWTTLFFGPIPALLRGDFLTFLGVVAVYVVLNVFTMGILGTLAMVVWAFMYNKYYTQSLLKKGFKFNGSDEDNKEAAMYLHVELNSHNTVDKNKGPEV